MLELIHAGFSTFGWFFSGYHFPKAIPLIFQTGRGSGVDPQKSCESRASGVSRRPNIGSARALMRAEKVSPWGRNNMGVK